MALNWEKLFKRYVWDDVRTPYFTSVAKLTRVQADYEVYAYALFLGIFFAVVAVTATTDRLPSGPAINVAVYAFSVVCAAAIFGFTKHYYAALYCAAAPIGAALYLYLFGFHPNLGKIDHIVIFVVLLLWMRYSVRIVSIGKTYEALPESNDPSPKRRRTPWR